MKPFRLLTPVCVALASTFAAVQPLEALPRDAVAVLNRCGKPLKGDEIIYESNSVAGGRRLLSYERGVLHFDRVGNDGWTFAYGTHKKIDHLDAAEMNHYLPCLNDALSDSAADAPIRTLTSTQRVVYSAKQYYKKLVIYTLASLVLIGVVFLIPTRRAEEEAF